MFQEMMPMTQGGGGSGKAMLLFENYGSRGGYVYFCDGSTQSRTAYPYGTPFLFENEYIKIEKLNAQDSTNDAITYKKAATERYENAPSNFNTLCQMFESAGTEKAAGSTTTGLSYGLYEKIFFIVWE